MQAPRRDGAGHAGFARRLEELAAEAAPTTGNNNSHGCCLLPVAVAFPLLRIPPLFRRLADPEGGAHGCAPFFDEGRMPSRKIPSSMNSRVCSGHKAFSLVPFL